MGTCGRSIFAAAAFLFVPNALIRAIRIFRLILGSALAGCAQAHANDASRCVDIEDAVARLACYDEAFGRTKTGVDASPAQKTKNAEIASENTSEPTIDAFGREHSDAPRPKNSLDSITARIERLVEAPKGLYTFQLDNGQTWRQSEASDAVRFRVGDEVAIKRGALGSFRLHKRQGGRAVPVKRVH